MRTARLVTDLYAHRRRRNQQPSRGNAQAVELSLDKIDRHFKMKVGLLVLELSIVAENKTSKTKRLENAQQIVAPDRHSR